MISYSVCIHIDRKHAYLGLNVKYMCRAYDAVIRRWECGYVKEYMYSHVNVNRPIRAHLKCERGYFINKIILSMSYIECKKMFCCVEQCQYISYHLHHSSLRYRRFVWGFVMSTIKGKHHWFMIG